MPLCVGRRRIARLYRGATRIARAYRGTTPIFQEEFGGDVFTKLLLHFDGADASTVFTDSSTGGAGSPHALTANGNAQIDTAQSKFGGASGLFDGSGDWISTPDHADFTLGSGDFTIDLWFRRNATGTQMLAGQISSTAAAASSAWYIQCQNAGNLLNAGISNGTSFTILQSTTALPVDGLWHHVAFVRSGNTLRLFLDGVQEDTDTFIGAVNDGAVTLSIGRGGELNSQYWNGWIDEFRLSAGVARWSANFTPPASAY